MLDSDSPPSQPKSKSDAVGLQVVMGRRKSSGKRADPDPKIKRPVGRPRLDGQPAGSVGQRSARGPRSKKIPPASSAPVFNGVRHHSFSSNLLTTAMAIHLILRPNGKRQIRSLPRWTSILVWIITVLRNMHEANR